MQWPGFLCQAGIGVKQGPTLQQMHEMAKRRLPNLGVPPPSEEENKWYCYIECFRGRARVKISAELLQPSDRYVITVYTTARWLFKSRALERLEEEIVSILCSNGGRLAQPNENETVEEWGKPADRYPEGGKREHVFRAGRIPGGAIKRGQLNGTGLNGMNLSVTSPPIAIKRCCRCNTIARVLGWESGTGSLTFCDRRPSVSEPVPLSSPAL